MRASDMRSLPNTVRVVLSAASRYLAGSAGLFTTSIASSLICVSPRLSLGSNDVCRDDLELLGSFRLLVSRMRNTRFATQSCQALFALRNVAPTEREI